MFAGMRADAPSRRHLRHWENVCRFLDAQPYRAVTYPYPSEIPISTRLLKRMARFRLVRHRDDCRWQLSPRWQNTLRRLWEGVIGDDARDDPSPAARHDVEPFIVDRGVDTLYANLLCVHGLPARLIATCDALKAQAQDEDATVETPWSVLGAPLSMYKAGKGASGYGRGVSWSYILRNAMVMVVLRKTPLTKLLGSVRLSAEGLWTLGPHAALDGVRADLRRMWAWAERGSFKEVAWQLSQIHLCVDVAHFSPSPTDLNRLLTRSLKKTVHLPSAIDVDVDFSADDVDRDGAFMDNAWLAHMAPPEWESVSFAAYDPADLDVYHEYNDDDSDTEDDAENFADEQGAAVHLWGQRASGIAFSPGSDLSAAWYDKALQERQTGKRWMEPIHRAGGWQTSMSLFRIEARFRRGVLRELSQARGVTPIDGDAGVPSFDDPWRCLSHLDDLWGYFAGLPPEADTTPDVTYRGWMRLTLPDGDDSNRARWQTDPTWTLIQRAHFNTAMPTALKRQPKISHDLDQLDAELYGLLKLRAALRGEYLTSTATLSQEVGAFVRLMDEVDAERGRDFADEVREKARMLGKPLPMRTDGHILPALNRPRKDGHTCK